MTTASKTEPDILGTIKRAIGSPSSLLFLIDFTGDNNSISKWKVRKTVWLNVKRWTHSYAFIAFMIITLCCYAVAASTLNLQRLSSDWIRPRQDIVTIHLPNGQVKCRLRCNRPLNECPPIDCPLPERPALNSRCPVPMCNEKNSSFVFPTPDPNFFYQCRQTDSSGHYEVMVMRCGCMTFFDYELQRW